MALVDLKEGARNTLVYKTSCNSLPRLVIKLWSFFVRSFVRWRARAPIRSATMNIWFQVARISNGMKSEIKKEKEKKYALIPRHYNGFSQHNEVQGLSFLKHSDSFVFFFIYSSSGNRSHQHLALATKSNEIDKRCDQRVSRAPAEYAMACKIYWLYSWVRWKKSMDYLWLSVD